MLGRRQLSPALALVLLAGCSSPGPIDSGDVSVRINGNASDIRQAGMIFKSTNISTTSGNPWGNFIKTATEACGGDPVGFEIASVTTRGQTAFESFVNGTMAVVFTHSTSGGIPTDPQATVASILNPTGLGPMGLQVSATRSSLAPLVARLRGGDFEVVMRAQTNRTSTDTFSFDVTVTINARAFCE